MSVKIKVTYEGSEGERAFNRLRSELEEFGYRAKDDISKVTEKKELKSEVLRIIRSVDVILILVTHETNESQSILLEYMAALSERKTIVGLIIEDCEIPEHLIFLNYLNFSSPQGYVISFAKLIQVLDAIKRTNDEEGNPYPEIKAKFTPVKTDIRSNLTDATESQIGTNLMKNDLLFESLQIHEQSRESVGKQSLSQGRIEISNSNIGFLGLPNSQQYREQQLMKKRVFVSYAGNDNPDPSTRLRDDLQRAGYDIWRAIEDMRGGHGRKEQLRQAIHSVDVVVVLLTPDSVISKSVLWDCDTAQTLGKRLIGLLILPCNVPDELSDLHYHDLSTPEKYTAGFASLIRDLNELKGASMTENDNGSRGFQLDMRNANLSNIIIGNNATMINNAPQDSAALIQQITKTLQFQHQQLRITLLSELGAMNAEQLQQIDMILQHYRSGQISTNDLNYFMLTMRELISQLRNGSLPANNELLKIGQQLEQVYGGTLTQQHQFELTLPIIPLFLGYKYSFGGSIDTDLRNLFDRLKQWWDLWGQ